MFAGSAVAGLTGTTPAFRAWATASAAMCAAQAAVLELPDPLAGHAATPAPVTPTRQASMTAAAASITARQTKLAATFSGLCQQAGEGDVALLFASLATAAHATATAKAPVAKSAVSPTHCDVGTRNDALQVVLSRVEAAVQGYELGAGRLAIGAAGVTSARARINALWALRDQVQGLIVGASATPAPPALDYAMPGPFNSVAAINRTWGLLERGLMDAWARVAAASTGADRASALRQMIGQANQTMTLGVGLTTWPGWA